MTSAGNETVLRSGASTWRVTQSSTSGSFFTPERGVSANCGFLRFADVQSAVEWLRPFRRDVSSMMELRRLAAASPASRPLWRTPDDDVLERVARLLHSGEFQVFAVKNRTLFSSATQVVAASFPSPPRRSSSPLAASSVAGAEQATAASDPETSSFSSGADPASIALCLKSAAACSATFIQTG